MRYDLPTAVEVNGTEYQIRSDYRDILTIIEALSDAELSEEEKAEAMLDIFYPDFAEMPQSYYEERSSNAQNSSTAAKSSVKKSVGRS